MTRTQCLTREACESAADAVRHEIEVLSTVPLNAASDSEALRGAVEHLCQFHHLLERDLVEYEKRGKGKTRKEQR
jgi:hypothetical protein